MPRQPLLITDTILFRHHASVATCQIGRTLSVRRKPEHHVMFHTYRLGAYRSTTRRSPLCKARDCNQVRTLATGVPDTDSNRFSAPSPECAHRIVCSRRPAASSMPRLTLMRPVRLPNFLRHRRNYTVDYTNWLSPQAPSCPSSTGAVLSPSMHSAPKLRRPLTIILHGTHLFVRYKPYTRTGFHPDRQYHTILVECCAEKSKCARYG